MIALYRSGRQANALEVYQRMRQRLVDELGVDPPPLPLPDMTIDLVNAAANSLSAVPL
jgi:hypothetical protein